METYLLGVLLFGVAIAITIGLHELGHYATARMFGMRVRRFFIGFGPRVFSWRKGHTEYGFKAIPLGGFCDIAGMTNQDEVTAEEAPHAMRNKPGWQRIIVLLGGIMMNILVCLVVLWGVAMTAGLPDPSAKHPPVIDELGCVASRQIDAQTLEPCEGQGPAQAAGLQSGDTVVSVDGQAVEDFETVRNYIQSRPGETVVLGVEREGKSLEFPVEVASATRLNAAGEEVTVGLIGVSRRIDPVEAVGPIPAAGLAARFTGDIFVASAKGLVSFPAKIPGVVASVFGAERDAESPMSVVGVSRVGGELVERDLWAGFFLMVASLNMFLAIFNLVPLPPLDGGHIAVVIYEKIRDALRRVRGLAPAGPADYNKLMPLTYAVMVVLLTLGVIVIAADVVNPIRLFG